MGTIMAVTSKSSVVLDITHTGTADAAPALHLAKTYAKTLDNGEANVFWYDAGRTVAASSSEDLDLAASLTDAYGATITFARVLGLVVVAAAGNTNNVVLGDDATAPWTTLLGADGTIAVRPGGVLAVMCASADTTGYLVTATTADILQVANSGSGTSVTYDVALWGKAT